MTNYYNEFDPFAAAWLRNLIAAGLIPAGDVDTRSITEVTPDDLKGYTQCHFFAGLGGWSRALELAGWPADEPVWTGSCPCQPFSTAGKRKGKDDERHLWPVWFELIRQSRPPVVFGEQVSSAIRHHWWDDVADDLEREGYTTRAEIRPACSVGAPHKRDRLWFVADAELCRRERQQIVGRDQLQSSLDAAQETQQPVSAYCSVNAPSFDVAHTTNEGFQDRGEQQIFQSGPQQEPQRRGGNGAMGHTNGTGPQGRSVLPERADKQSAGPGGLGAWGSGVWIDCPDGKQRLVEPGIPLLAYGVSGRMVVRRAAQDGKEEEHWYSRTGTLRGLGNAIVPQVAAEFIGAYTRRTHWN